MDRTIGQPRDGQEPSTDPALSAEDAPMDAALEAVVSGDAPFGALFGLDSDDIHAFADLADDLLAAGRARDALVLYEGCVLLDPLDVTLLCGYAVALRHAGDAARANQVADLVRSLAGEDPDVQAFLESTSLAANA